MIYTGKKIVFIPGDAVRVTMPAVDSDTLVDSEGVVLTDSDGEKLTDSGDE